VIPVNEPRLDGREMELLAECIRTGFISSDGPFVREFEARMAAYLGTAHGVAVCNGTAALETALFAAGIGEGDEVIMPAFTIISCAVAAIRLGAVPVLVDAEPETWNMDVSRIEAKLTPRTRAIMAVHIYGHPTDMDPLLELARRHRLKVIEDAAEVHGAEYKGRKCGNLGDVAAFSFYANKIVTTGEGGMVVTKDPGMAERARSYRNLCFRPDRRFLHTELGYNFRMTNLQAALGVAQMDRIDEFVEIKRRLGARYVRGLSTLDGIKCQVEKPWARMVYWMYCVELDPRLGLTAAALMDRLAKKGIGCRPFFLGLHEQPVLRERGWFAGEEYPVTERIARQGLYLPSGLTLTESQVDEVLAAVAAALRAGPGNG